MVLLIDDGPGFRAIVQPLLKRKGYRVVQATDGAAGVAKFKEEKPDIVLLDLSMPGMDGIEACQRLRRTEGGETVPILIITVRSQIATVSDCLNAGATDYLLKPFEPEDFLARIAAALGSSTTGG